MASDFTQHPEAETKLIAWDTLRVTLLWAYGGTPGMKTGSRPLSNFFAWYLRSGSVDLTLADQTIHVEQGQWCILPPGEVDRHFSDDAQLMSLSFQFVWPDGSRLFDFRLPQVVTAEQGKSLLRPAEALVEHVSHVFPDAYLFLPLENTSAATYLRLQRLVFDWAAALTDTLEQLGHTIHTMARMDDRIIHARELMDQAIFSQSLSESDIASQIGLSTSQFTRLFTSQFNMTPKRYMDQQRLTLAKRMLRSSEMSVKQLAFNMGFKQLSHFSNWFRKHQGVSPRKYRHMELRPSSYGF